MVEVFVRPVCFHPGLLFARDLCSPGVFVRPGFVFDRVSFRPGLLFARVLFHPVFISPRICSSVFVRPSLFSPGVVTAQDVFASFVPTVFVFRPD